MSRVVKHFNLSQRTCFAAESGETVLAEACVGGASCHVIDTRATVLARFTGTRIARRINELRKRSVFYGKRFFNPKLKHFLHSLMYFIT